MINKIIKDYKNRQRKPILYDEEWLLRAERFRSIRDNALIFLCFSGALLIFWILMS